MVTKLKLTLIGLLLISFLGGAFSTGHAAQVTELGSGTAAIGAVTLWDSNTRAAGHLEYPLQDGYIHNWLVAGPQEMPPPGLDQPADLGERMMIAGQSPVPLPIEDESCGVGDGALRWCYYRSLEDHLVDLTGSPGTFTLAVAWAYAQIVSPSPKEVTLILTTAGPADLWLNGQLLHREERSPEEGLSSFPIRGELLDGRNQILVRFEARTAVQRDHLIALRLIDRTTERNPSNEDATPLGAAVEATVTLPTYIEDIARRQMFERLFDQAYLERDVVHWKDPITLHWSEDLATQESYAVRVQSEGTQIHFQGKGEAKATSAKPISLLGLPEGEYDTVLMPPIEEYHLDEIRYLLPLSFHLVENPYSERAYGTYEGRRREALDHAARRDDGLYGQMAKLELLRRSTNDLQLARAERARWAAVDGDTLLAVVGNVAAGDAHSEAELVGLLGMLYRYPDEPRLPRTLQAKLGDAVVDSGYWRDEREATSSHSSSEDGGILRYTSQILAGQLYPDRAFGGSDRTGRWYRQLGERAALEWMSQRASVGLTVGESDEHVQWYLVALSHLADLAEDRRIRDQATATLDRILLTMALNVHRGVVSYLPFQSRASTIKSGQLSATAGATRLLWGTGVYNRHVMATVSLASSGYALPSSIGQVADSSGGTWVQQVGPSVANPLRTLLRPASKGAKATYKTPEYLLSSVQDYRPGQRGNGEHIWQATMGADALVFVTHPANMSESDAHPVGFWHGNAVLPRVAQWKDTLVTVHQLPDDDWMGYTHAYYPVHTFDEYAIRDGWAFARVGDGYVALSAAQGIQLTKRGPGAYRELRSYGKDNVWVCLMGRKDSDESFQDFQEAVLALNVRYGKLSVQMDTLRGDVLSFGWTGPLQVQARKPL